MQQILAGLRDTVLPWARRGQMRVFPDEQLQTAAPGHFLDLITNPKDFRTFYEWMWITEGEAPLRIGDAVYLLCPGDFCILPPLTHRTHVYSRETSTFESLYFAYWPGTLLAHIFQYTPFGTWHVPERFFSYGSPALGAILAAMQQEISADRPQKADALQGLVLQLIAASLRDLEAAEKIPDLPFDADSAVAFIHRVLHERYQHDWTLSALAEEVHLHPRYLATRFKTQTGRTIFEALRDIRMEHAKSLLLEGRMPLDQIARAVGYRNADRFARVFREATGQSPTRFGNHKHNI